MRRFSLVIIAAALFAQWLAITATAQSGVRPFLAPESPESEEWQPGDPIEMRGLPALRPVVSSGRRDQPILAFDPFVLRDQEGYHLFVTSLFCNRDGEYYYSWDPANPGGCNILDVIGGTAYAFSSDGGLSWTFRSQPAAAPTPGGWDGNSVETPSVVRVGERLYMFYSGEGRQLGQRFQIGMATLDLVGGSIRRTLLETPLAFVTREEPILPFDTTEPSAFNNVQEPTVLYQDERFVLYFLGLELLLPDRAARSPGQAIRSMSLHRRVLDLGGVTLTSDDRILEQLNMPEIVRVGGYYYLFSATLGPGEYGGGSDIEYWISADGLDWRHGATFDLGKPPFANFATISPTVLLDAGRLVMFYTALEVADHPCLPVPAHGRMGIPIENDTRCVYSSMGRAESRRSR